MATFGQRLKGVRTAIEMSQQELADRIGTTKQAISQYENDKRRPDYDTLRKLSDIFYVSSDYLLGKSDSAISVLKNVGEINTRKFRVLGNVSCGEPIFMAEEKELYVEAGADIQADFVLYARGDSMINARINDGDIVFIREQPMVNDGEIAAVAIEDECTLKRFYYDREHSTVTLVSENPRYAPMVFYGERLNQIRVIGKAVAFQSDVK